MIFTIAYHSGDKEQVRRWLSWAEELGGLGVHRLFLMPCKGQAADFATTIPFEVIEDAQGIVSDWSESSENSIRDASGANSMIRQAAWFFYLKKLGPWMFIEPDCIPTRAGWADEIEAEYQRGGKPFMAAFVPGIPGAFPDHATGNMVLPERTPEISRLLMLPSRATVEGDPSARVVELAFDVAAASEILPKCHFTDLIQHVFRGPKFTSMEHLARVSPSACLFHTDKDGGLITLLRNKRRGGLETAPAESHKLADAGSNPAPAPIAKPKVHTFFRPCVDQQAFEEQKRILAIWEKNWREHGWEPVILTEVHARKHPEYEKLKAAFAALPTVSPKEYEMACWMRHVAMAAIPERGSQVLVDYDTLNNNYSAGEFLAMSCGQPKAIDRFPTPVILSDKNPVPCAMLGTPEGFDYALNRFLECPIGEEQGKPHLSDQIAVQKLGFPAKDICREFGKPGWESAKLIHFSHAACGRERSKRMQEWCNISIMKEDDFVVKDIKRAVKECNAVIDAMTPADCIDRLVELSKKDGFAKGRIVKQLRAAGLLPKK